jgi:integrase
MKKRPTFQKLAEMYIGSRLICHEYKTQLLRIAGLCGSVTNEAVNAYLRSRQGSVATVTLRNERGHLLTLWKFGYQTGVLDDMPRGILTVRMSRPPTRAWTPAQIRTLLDAAEGHRNVTMRSGASRAAFLRAWIFLGYETGARLGDVMSFSECHLRGDSIAWTQSKTGDPLTRVLTRPCRDACGEMLGASPDGRIIGWATTKRNATRIMRSLIDAAGLSGTGKWLRRSGATHCEMIRAGAGRLHLGHRSPALFEQAYCDWAQLRTVTPQAPSLLEEVSDE